MMQNANNAVIAVAVGDIVSIKGIPGHWKIAAIEARRLMLTSCTDSGADLPFNNAVGTFWIEVASA